MRLTAVTCRLARLATQLYSAPMDWRGAEWSYATQAGVECRRFASDGAWWLPSVFARQRLRANLSESVAIWKSVDLWK